MGLRPRLALSGNPRTAQRLGQTSRQGRKGRSAAEPQPNGAKRLECVPACRRFRPPNAHESGSKLRALQTLRALSHVRKILAACEQFALLQCKGGDERLREPI